MTYSGVRPMQSPGANAWRWIAFLGSSAIYLLVTRRYFAAAPWLWIANIVWPATWTVVLTWFWRKK
jgi:hypothetical protein